MIRGAEDFYQRLVDRIRRDIDDEDLQRAVGFSLKERQDLLQERLCNIIENLARLSR